MTANQFRHLALSLPQASEKSHMNHPDFRIGGKVFATLAKGDQQGMVKLTPSHQAALVRAEPDVFQPASGAWGRAGCTMVTLKTADAETVRDALLAAWRGTAPKRLLEELDEEP